MKTKMTKREQIQQLNGQTAENTKRLNELFQEVKDMRSWSIGAEQDLRGRLSDLSTQLAVHTECLNKLRRRSMSSSEVHEENLEYLRKKAASQPVAEDTTPVERGCCECGKRLEIDSVVCGECVAEKEQEHIRSTRFHCNECGHVVADDDPNPVGQVDAQSTYPIKSFDAYCARCKNVCTFYPPDD